LSALCARDAAGAGAGAGAASVDIAARRGTR
jgi:hypothetical protein